MKIVRRATELALNQGAEQLTLEFLANAYDDRLRADHPNRDNAFLIEKSDLEVIPFYEPEMNFGFLSGRSRKKAREERASDVLTKK